MRTIGAGLCLILTAAGSTAPVDQDTPPTETVRTAFDAQQRMTVQVGINGRGPYRFLVDTGSQASVISAELAAELNLPSGRAATLVGLGPPIVAATAEIDEVALGHRRYSGIRMPLLARRDIGADGVLGTDSLQNQRVLLDYEHKLLRVDEPRSLGGDTGFEIVVRAHRRAGQLIITNARIDGVDTRVVIDTGSEMSIGNRALQRALSRRGVPSQSVLVGLTGQQTAVDLGYARQLTFGSLTIGNVLIGYTDAPAFAALHLAARPALLLGARELRGFKRVAIDFAARKVLLDMPSGL